MADIYTRPSYKKHPDEEFLDGLEERFNQDLDNLLQFAVTDGRMIFQVPISDAEKWQRFSNPSTRARIIKQILQTDGPEGVVKYVHDITRVSQKVVKADPEGTGPRSNLTNAG